MRALKRSLLAGIALAAVTAHGAGHAAHAQDANELAELRALVRQQAQQLQTMQKRLDAVEKGQSADRARALAAARDQAPLRSSEGGSPDTRSLRAKVAAGGTPASEPPTSVRPVAVAGGRGPSAADINAPNTGDPSQAGGVQTAPRQEQATAQTPAPAPQGQPPLAVLSGNDRVQVGLSGQIDRLFLAHADGSGKVDTYFADNNVSSTRIRALGSARLDDTNIAVSALEFDLRSNTTASITRQSVNNNGGDSATIDPFRVRRAEVGLQSADYGSILFGRGSTFADGIAEFDLSGTDVAFYSYLPDSGGALQFANTRLPYRRATDPTISQVYDDFDGPRDDRIRYDSPSFGGLILGGSIAQGIYWDVGARYAAEFGKTKIATGIAYMDYAGTLPSQVPANVVTQDGSQAATTPFSRRVAGSVAVLLPNGLNFAASGGLGRHYGSCCGGANVAHDDAATYYLKAGYQAHLLAFGTTNFAIDAGQTFNRIRDGDIATRFGAEVDQQVIAKGVEIFAGWQHLILRRSGVSYQDSDLGLIGSRVQF